MNVLSTIRVTALVPCDEDPTTGKRIHVLPIHAGYILAVNEDGSDTPSAYLAQDTDRRTVGTFDTFDDAEGVLEALALRDDWNERLALAGIL